jgi:hypothetical protein
MPTIQFKDYIQSDIRVQQDTLGGDTYIIDGRPTCFAFTRKHYNAVMALTGEKSRDYGDIKVTIVHRLVKKGLLIVTEEDCRKDYGWMGARVWDGDEQYIGTVGARCSRSSGEGTSHVGTAKCRYHGMDTTDAFKVSLVQTGKQAVCLQKYLADRVDKYLTFSQDRKRFLSLDRELALQKAALDMVVEFAKELEDPAANAIRISEHITASVEKIGRQIERIQKMENAAALNASQVLYLQKVVAALFNEYITDPQQRELAVMDLMQRIGTRGSLADETIPALMRLDA